MVPRFFVQMIGLWCCAFGLIAKLNAAEILEPPRAEALTPTSATIRWYTEVPTGTRVHYGLGPNRLTQEVEAGVGTLHEVVLDHLAPGTNYFFAVGTARRLLATGQFSTSPLANTAPVSTSPVEKARALLGRWFGDSSAAMATPPPVSSSRPIPPLSTTTTPATRAPAASATWGNPASLPDHFARHGADFGAKSAEDYAAKAWQFRQRAREGGLLVKVDDDGVQRVFDPATGAFAAYNRDGTTKTFFKPGSAGYFSRQPGRLVGAHTP